MNLLEMAQVVKPQSLAMFIHEAYMSRGIHLGVKGMNRIKRMWENEGVLPEIVTTHLMKVILQTPRKVRWKDE